MFGEPVNTKPLKICDSCPWIIANQGKPHPAGWYTLKNLRRLWSGIRTGRAPGMICHSTDPGNVDYGGAAPVKPGHEAECGGAVLLVIRTFDALNENKPQPFKPPMTKGALARWFERCILNDGVPQVEAKHAKEEIGVP